MEATPDKWLRRLMRLRIDRSRGNPAPHKPLLLLLVIELAEQSSLARDILPLSPELAFRFATIWSIVAQRRQAPPDIRLPFHHMTSDGCWASLTVGGQPSPDSATAKLAAFAADFREVLDDEKWRDQAKAVLVSTYFTPNEQRALRALFRMPLEETVEGSDVIRQLAVECERQGREARFRLDVVSAYNYTCSLTGHRLTTISIGSIVDAAHIHQFSDSRNNDQRNGIALCKNAHWLFDHGLWSVTDDYRVVVAIDHFCEDCPDGRMLNSYQDERIRLPVDREKWPNPIHLAWHRRNRFRGAT